MFKEGFIRITAQPEKESTVSPTRKRIFLLIQEISKFGSLHLYHNITEIFGIKWLQPWVAHSSSIITLRFTE